MHDPNTMQTEHPIPQDLAHAPNLSIPPLGEDNAEQGWTESFNPARFARTVENDNPLSHAVNERVIEWMIDGHLVFPLMPMLRSQNLVHDVPVVREQDETGRVLVESADWKDPLRMADFRNDITRYMRLTGRRHTHRLVILDIEWGCSPGNHLSIPRDDVVGTDLVSQAGRPLIDGHATGFDQTIGFSPGTDAVLCEKFIDAKSIGHRVASYFSRLRKIQFIRNTPLESSMLVPMSI